MPQIRVYFLFIIIITINNLFYPKYTSQKNCLKIKKGILNLLATIKYETTFNKTIHFYKNFLNLSSFDLKIFLFQSFSWTAATLPPAPSAPCQSCEPIQSVRFAGRPSTEWFRLSSHKNINFWKKTDVTYLSYMKRTILGTLVYCKVLSNMFSQCAMEFIK